MSTIGTALAHARDNQEPVDVLVEGHWLRGDVVLLDGYGVVVDRHAGGQSVIRLENISAVTVGSDMPVLDVPAADIPRQPGTHRATQLAG